MPSHCCRSSDKIVSHFKSNGAIATRRAANGGGADADFSVRVFSTGNVKTRAGSGSTEYQFEGDISTSIDSDARMIMEDNYSGIGGWNPVSEKMAMEVLGIHVYKRFVDRLNRELGS